MPFFQTVAENLRCYLTALTMEEESVRQHGNGKFLEPAEFEVRKL